MPATKRSAQAVLVVLLGFLTALLAWVSAWSWKLDAGQILALTMAIPMALWLGGAVTGQIILARLLDRGSNAEILAFVRQLMAVIVAFFVPMSIVAGASGTILAVRNEIPFTTAKMLIPLSLYALTCIVGALVSAPGYRALLQFAETHGPNHPAIRRRLMPLAWVNRIELVLVIGIGVPTIIASV